jgi:hypothetical protein
MKKIKDKENRMYASTVFAYESQFSILLPVTRFHEQMHCTYFSDRLGTLYVIPLCCSVQYSG